MSASSRRRAPSLRAARLIRRALLPAAIVCGVLLWRNFGTLRVPRGMDTMPELPPGTLCVIDKQPSSLQAGQVVFVDVRDGTVLSRIESVDGDRLTIRHDAADSMLPDSADVGPVPVSAVRALVLSWFATEGNADPESGSGSMAPRSGR